MTQYMHLKSKTYTNEKAHRLKLRPDPFCSTCTDTIEDQKHLFHDCPKAIDAWKIYEIVTGEKIDENQIDYGPNNLIFLNVYSLIKHSIYARRNDDIKDGSLKSRAQYRLSDLRIIKWRDKSDPSLET